jgi:hypothetical protein
MLRSGTACLALLGALAAMISAAPGAVAAAPRYASAGGSGTACTSASPCTITQAVQGATGGSEVIVNPGDYPLTATLDDPAPITIRGVPGRPRPRLLFSGGGQQGVRLDSGSTLRFVEVRQTQATAALWTHSGLVDQVVVKGSGAGVVTSTIQSSTVRDSVIVAPGAGATATRTITNGGPSTSTYRNTTAVAPGSGGVAIEAEALGAAGKTTINLVNTIAKAGPAGASLAMTTDGSGATATITASHTNWANYLLSGTNTQYVDLGGNQGTPPAFVDAAADDYRQTAKSLTIGAGLTASANGAFDVDGDPRAVGTTDIGADEYVSSPSATTGTAGAVTPRSARLTGSVDPKGAPTTYRFEYGTTTAYGHSTATAGAGSGMAAVAAAATLAGLTPGTTYHYRIVAANAGGVASGGDRTFTTAPPPRPSTSPSPPGTTPAQPFAGIALASGRLTYERGTIAVTLRCPAGTTGRCTGRTRLTARPRRTSTRRVTLGRANFSVAPGRRGRIAVRVTRAGRHMLRRVPRLRARAVTAARDGAGQARTTRTAVTIRRRHR